MTRPSMLERTGRFMQPCWASTIVVVVALSFPQAAFAQEKQPERNDVRIENLIEALASSNAPPVLLDPLLEQGPYYSRHDALPPGYDLKTQVRVIEAWQALATQGYDAFPALVKYSDDKRYSHTRCYRRGPTFRNVTVGEVCRDIIRLHVDAWWPQFRFMGTWRPHTLPPCDELPRWWQQRQGKTLRDLQVESIAIALSQIKNMSKRELGDNDGDEPSRVANIETFERLLKQMNTADRPVRMEGLGIERTPEIIVDLPEGFDNRTFKWRTKDTGKENRQHDAGR